MKKLALAALLLSGTAAYAQQDLVITGPSGPYTFQDAVNLLPSGYANLPVNLHVGSIAPTSIYNPLVPAGWVSTEGITSTVVASAGGTAINTSGFGFYVRNLNPSTGSGANAVGLFGEITCQVNNCASWGINPTLNDSADNVGTGGTGRTLIGAEFDFTVVNAGTTVQGVSLNGSSNVQPTASNGFTCGSLSGTVGVAKWDKCFVVGNGMATVGLYLGPQSATGVNVGTAPIQFAYRDGTGTGQSINLTANSDALYTQGNHTIQGNFSVTGTVVAPLTTPSSSTASCAAGRIEWDASFIYVCISADHWKRSALAAF